MHMVDDWKQAWKWISINCMALAAVIQTTWLSLPDDLREMAPKNIVHWITITLLVLGIAGRLIKQGSNNGIDTGA